MKKERFDVIASSLSNYFGVGFLTVDEQLDVDLGLVPKEFDDEAQDRMDLGNAMEDGCLDYFENRLKILIDERNSEMKYAVDGKLKCKRDGRTYIDGIETGVENKYSNAQSKCFVDDIGYHLQCHGYMMAWDLKQWLLCGMWQGKPAMKLIKKDKEVQKDIEIVVTAVSEILMGIRDREDYPWDIVEKYSKKTKPVVLEELEEYDITLFDELARLKKIEKQTKDRIEELSRYAKATYDSMTYQGKTYKVTISDSSKKGTINFYELSIDHPEIDLEKYRNKDSEFKKIVVTQAKKKGMVA